MKTNLTLTQMACILANEAGILHCTLDQAWQGMHPGITAQFNYDAVLQETARLEQEYIDHCNEQS